MVSTFLIYDLSFLVVFTLAVGIFLFVRRENIERQGIMFLYKTKFGIKAIDWVAERFEPILKPLQYLVILSGYFLMISAVWLIIYTTYIYIRYPIVSQTIKAPPLAPLIPYFPTLFGLQAFFPQLYFTVFIVALSIVALSHEFSHGIFARLHKLKIQSTGLAFLGPILGAFVEPDEKKMEKAPRVAQMSVLAAGTFANVVMAALFTGILWLFFISAFMPAGITFTTYAESPVNLTQVTSINGVSITNVSTAIAVAPAGSIINLTAENATYYTQSDAVQYSIQHGISYIIAFENTPAYRAKLQGAISMIGTHKVDSYKTLQSAIDAYKPGDTVAVQTITSTGTQTKNITFADRNGTAFLGIGVAPQKNTGVVSYLFNNLLNPRNSVTYYASKIGDFGIFIYNLLWWIVIINVLVAIFNMLPLSILDGGRFFYLTIWGITGSEKFGRRAFKFSTWFILLLFLALMIRWLFIFIP